MIPGATPRLFTVILLMLAIEMRAEEKLSDQAWVKISLPNLTLLTSVPQPAAEDCARDLAQYLSALRNYFAPMPLELTPLTMVIFAQRREFQDYRPLGQDGKPEWVGGYFLRHESWAVIALPAGKSGELRRTLFHEGAHWIMDGAGYANALWLNEGMAEAFSTFRVEGGEACWGEDLPQHLKLLRHGDFEPFAQLVSVSRDFFARDSDRTNLFYAQSWAFAHLMLFGGTAIPRDAFAAYNRALVAGVNAEGAFSTSFGLTYEEMDRQVAQYVAPGRSHRALRQPLTPPSDIKVEAASATEVDEALGRLAIVGHRYAQAVARGEAMVTRDPSDARGHALLGLAKKEKGEDDAALKEFEFAVRDGATEFQPYLELGNAVRTSAANSGSELSTTSARRAADYYEEAIQRYDRFEGSYINLAGVIGLAEPLRPRDIAALRRGAHLFPENMMISLGIAQWYFRSGDRKDARALLEEVLTRETSETSEASVAAKFAQQVRDGWDSQEFFEAIVSLAAHQQYDEALERLDRRAVSSNLLLQFQFQRLRRDIVGAQQISLLNEALANERWPEARRLIDVILDSDASPAAKMSARRALIMIDRGAVESGSTAPTRN